MSARYSSSCHEFLCDLPERIESDTEDRKFIHSQLESQVTACLTHNKLLMQRHSNGISHECSNDAIDKSHSTEQPLQIRQTDYL